MKAPSRALLALVAILVLAAVLRFTALGWGLRHEPDWDERVFVQSAAWMVASGDLDHRFYEYPGLAVYLMAPAVVRHDPPEVGPGAYLDARRIVAGFGVLSVLLVYLLGRRLGGEPVGLAAALLLAVSPLDVHTAHMVRPDVLLATAFLLALLVFDALPERRRGDLAAGLAIGLAAAVKFTGALIVPSYLIRRWSTPGARVRGTAIAGAASLGTFVLLSPYSFLHWGRFMEGLGTQWTYHYVRDGARTFASSVWLDLLRLEDSFKPLAALLIVIGLFLAARDGRRWWPALILPLVIVVVMSTADITWPRFLVPITGVLALLAGRVVAALYARAGVAAATALALLAAAPPALQCARYVRELGRPGARDRALDWIEAHAADGARILTTVKDLGLDRRRFEVLVADRLDPATRDWAAQMDLIVSGPQDDPGVVAAMEAAHVEESSGLSSDVTVKVLTPPPTLRRSYVPLPLPRAGLAVSENAATAAAMIDGDLATFWRTEGAQVPEESWIEVGLPHRALVGRVVLGLGRHWRREPRNLHVWVRDEPDGAWRRVVARPGRAPLDRQPPSRGERSVELVFDPVPATAVRLVQVGRGGKHWNVAELRVDALADAP